MNTLLPAAIIAVAITGYFAWNSYNAPIPQSGLLDQCHRLAGEVRAVHDKGGVVSQAMLSEARGCSVSFGQDWAADNSPRVTQLRAEGAMRVR